MRRSPDPLSAVATLLLFALLLAQCPAALSTDANGPLPSDDNVVVIDDEPAEAAQGKPADAGLKECSPACQASGVQSCMQLPVGLRIYLLLQGATECNPAVIPVAGHAF